jgi:hypothetical protein
VESTLMRSIAKKSQSEHVVRACRVMEVHLNA